MPRFEEAEIEEEEQPRRYEIRRGSHGSAVLASSKNAFKWNKAVVCCTVCFRIVSLPVQFYKAHGRGICMECEEENRIAALSGQGALVREIEYSVEHARNPLEDTSPGYRPSFSEEDMRSLYELDLELGGRVGLGRLDEVNW